MKEKATNTDHFEVMVEEINSNVKVMLEILVGLSKDFGQFKDETRDNFLEVRNDIAGLKGHIARIEEKLDEHDGRFDQIDEKLRDHDSSFTTALDYLSSIDDEVVLLRKDFEILKAEINRRGITDQKVLARLEDFEMRIKELEVQARGKSKIEPVLK